MKRYRVYRRKGSATWWADCHVGGRRFRKSTGETARRAAETAAAAWVDALEVQFGERRARVVLSTAIARFTGHCRESGLARLTVRGYESRLRIFLGRVGDVDVSMWTPDEAHTMVADYLAARANEVTSTTHDRVVLSALFNYLRRQRWYVGENPADAKLHGLRRPRRQLKPQRRCTSPQEDLALRQKGQKSVVWPILLLTRWAGLRRGEACTVRWNEINLDEGYLDVSGHEFGRKHPRRVWLASWVVLQLRALRPGWLPDGGDWPLWPYAPDRATVELTELCRSALGDDRVLEFNDLRASFTTDVFSRGLSAMQESMIVGHSPQVAQKHYSEYEAKEARAKLPPDPLVGSPVTDDDADTQRRVAQ